MALVPQQLLYAAQVISSHLSCSTAAALRCPSHLNDTKYTYTKHIPGYVIHVVFVIFQQFSERKVFEISNAAIFEVCFVSASHLFCVTFTQDIEPISMCQY